MEDENGGVRPEGEDEDGGEQEEEEDAVEEDGDSALWTNVPLQIAMARKASAIMRYLPTISQDGCLVPSSAAAVAVPTGTGDGKGKGKGKGKARANLPPPASVAAAFMSRFPQAPICRPAESAEMLAKAVIMHPDKATKKLVSNTFPQVEASRQAAMAMFATQHVAIALYVHEVVFFEELVALKQFQVQTPSGMGVRMICPSCKTNEFVQPPGVTGNGFPGLYGNRLRVAHDVDGVVVPVSGKYRCKNPRCSLVKESARKAAAKLRTDAGNIAWDDAAVLSYCDGGVAFNTMDERYMKLLPAAITSKLPFRFFKQNGTSERLLDMVRATEGDTTVLHKILDAGNKGQEIRDMRGYMRFARKEQAMEERQSLDRRHTAWPAWKFNIGTLISTPSVIVLNTFYKAGHEEEKYHMNAELVRESNSGGEFLNMDATFRVAGRTMDDAHCLFFALGENGKVHFYAAIKSESMDEIEPLLKRYAERRRRYGTLLALRWLYDDLCCRGAADPSKSSMVLIYPRVSRSSLCDSFHMLQNLVGATTSKDHPRKIQFSKEVGAAIRFKYQPDVDKVVHYLMNSKKMRKDEAEIRARSKAMAPYLRTISRAVHLTIADLERVVAFHERLDEEGRQRNELPLLQPNGPGGKSGPRGARAALKRVISCLKKGCGTDPLEVDGMHIALGTGVKTGLTKYSKKGGTGKNEAMHGSFNRMVAGLSRIGSDACEMRLGQRVHRYNFTMSRKLGETSKQSTPWVWRERTANDEAAGVLAAVPFPRAGPPPDYDRERDYEPMGFEYAKLVREGKLQACRRAAREIAGGRNATQPSAGKSSQGVCGTAGRIPALTVITGADAGVTGGAAAAGGGCCDAGGGFAGGSTDTGAGNAERGDIAPSALGGAATSHIQANLGGARVRTMRHPTVESQQCVTPRNPQETAALALAVQTQKGATPSQIHEAATVHYNTNYFVQEYSRNPDHGLRGPTSVRQVQNLSREVANAAAAAARAKHAATLSQEGSPPPPAKRKRNRGDVAAARNRVAARTPLAREEAPNITDTLARAYLQCMKLSTTGNRDEKRRRLSDYFDEHSVDLFVPPVVEGAAAAAAVAGTAASGGVIARAAMSRPPMGVPAFTAGAGTAFAAAAGAGGTLQAVNPAAGHGMGAAAAAAASGGAMAGTAMSGPAMGGPTFTAGAGTAFRAAAEAGGTLQAVTPAAGYGMGAAAAAAAAEVAAAVAAAGASFQEGMPAAGRGLGTTASGIMRLRGEGGGSSGDGVATGMPTVHPVPACQADVGTDVEMGVGYPRNERGI